MMRLIRAEILKVTTTKFVYGLGLAIVGLTALFTVGSLIQDPTETMHLLGRSGGMAEAMGQMVLFYTVLLFILGLIAVPSEFRHGTITPVLLTRPRRWQLMVAKAVVYGTIAGLMMVAAIATLALIGIVWASAADEALPMMDLAAWYMALRLVVSSVGICLLGLGIGALVKNQLAAVLGGFVWAFLIEHILVSTLPRIGNWLPFRNNEIFAFGTNTASLGKDLPQWWVGALVLAAYTGIACMAGTYVLRRRDIA